MSEEKTGWEGGKYKFTLSSPIESFGEQIDVITMRVPTGGDVMAIGNPVSLNMKEDEPAFKFNDARMGAMISRIGNIPPASIASLVVEDFIGLEWVLAAFFMPTTRNAL